MRRNRRESPLRQTPRRAAVTTHRHRCKAFTLIELLIVIAIIALLLSILLPSLARAKEAARIALCATNQRAIHSTIMLYAEEHNRHLPATVCGGGGWDGSDNRLVPPQGKSGTAITQIQAWYKGNPADYPIPKADWSLCPSDEDPAHTFDNDDATQISYTLYGWLWVYTHMRRASIYRAMPLDRLSKDNHTLRETDILLVAESIQDSSAGVGSFRGAQHAYPTPYGMQVQFRYLFRHRGGTGMNATCLDGHVSYQTWDGWDIPSVWSGYWQRD